MTIRGTESSDTAIAASLDRSRVLIVEHDMALRHVLQDLCSEYGWSAGGADMIEEALNIARLRRPQLVLIDADHGQRNTVELVRSLLALCPTMPVIVMMSQVSDEIAIPIELAGGIAVVVNPRSLREIVRLLKHYQPAGPGAARHADRLAADALRHDRAVRIDPIATLKG